ncbi:ketosynthase chain-length factor, partial [Streptomyces sp. NBC_00291]
MNSRSERASVITGIGVVAPNGIGIEAFWKATQAGDSVLDRVSRQGCEHLPLRIAGEVRGFDPGTLVEDRFLVQTDRFSHYALGAADLALEDARLAQADYADDAFSVGVVTAAGSGGGEFGQREL